MNGDDTASDRNERADRRRTRFCPRCPGRRPMDVRAGMSVCQTCGHCPQDVQVSR